MRYLKDPFTAQDVLQETFINVFKYAGTYQHQGSFEGWLKRIAVNCSLTWIKKHKRMHFDTIGPAEDQDLKTEIPDAYANLGYEAIMALLDKLPQSFAAVFNLYVVEGYSHEEIGEMLQISASTSRAALSRARSRLIDLLQAEAARGQQLLSIPII